MWVILSYIWPYYFIDDCQLYSTLLGLKQPWKVSSVSLDTGKKTVDVYVKHDKGSRLLCPVCGKECMIYDHLGERVWRDLDSIEFIDIRPCKLSEDILP